MHIAILAESSQPGYFSYGSRKTIREERGTEGRPETGYKRKPKGDKMNTACCTIAPGQWQCKAAAAATLNYKGRG